MALVQISDVVVPEVYADYMVNNTVEEADIFTSGIVKADDQMVSMLSGGGRLFNHPVWNDLANATPAVPTDSTSDVLTPAKLGSFKHQFIRQYRTYGWSDADLSRELAGSDPMARISSRTAAWWNRYFNRYTVSVLNGIIADNVANDSSDMVHNITALTGTVTHGAATTDAFKLNAGAILEAKQTMGDEAEGLSVIIMHSRLYTNLQLQNLIAFIPNAQGVINIPTYQGYRVLVTDTCPAVAVSSDVHYTSYLCGEGILGWAESPPAVPVAIQREELQGNGAGVETLVTRRQFALHPYGFSFTDASTAGTFATDAEVEAAANWNRAVPERKQIKFAAIITKNG